MLPPLQLGQWLTGQQAPCLLPQAKGLPSYLIASCKLHLTYCEDFKCRYYLWVSPKIEEKSARFPVIWSSQRVHQNAAYFKIYASKLVLQASQDGTDLKFCFLLTSITCCVLAVQTLHRQAWSSQQVSVRESHLSSLRCQTKSITISHRKEEQTRTDPSHLKFHSLLLTLQPTKIHSFSLTVSLAFYVLQTLLKPL